MLKTQSLSFSYSNTDVLNFPDIDVQVGSHTLIIGSSGSGKTTLLHILAGLRKPDSGRIVIDGIDITKLTGTQLDRFRGEKVGVVFQTPHFIGSLSVGENIAIARQLSGRSVDHESIANLLDRLHIGDKGNRPTYDLSVGEQQRVAIARALVNHPQIIFADEPTSALDDSNTSAVVDLLREQAEASGATLIVVTHDKRLKDYFTNQIEL